ncbi:MAG TPA: glycosyltransferase family 4 protein [Gemmatimonadales bacterium]|nr:glycosyltransferase family 4 protein [Gemmatimonadales bacterium]
MRVCHITTVHPAEDARIFYRMCSGLAQRDVSVVLVAPAEARTDSPVRMSRWNTRIGRAGRLSRIVLALRAALDERADVYHFHDPELIPLGLALKALRPTSAVVYDVHEDYPSMMLEKYWLPRWTRGAIARAARVANWMAGRFLDGIVTADPGVEQDFRTGAGDRTLVYYNFPVPRLFAEGPADPAGPKVDLVYIGGMSARAGTFVLLDALTVLAAQGIRPTVRLAGYTDGEAGRLAVQTGIQSRRLEGQVEIRGRIPHSKVPAWIRSGRIGLVTLQPIPKFMKNIPSKMFEYWACGLPVVAGDLPPIGQFLVDGQNGLLFSPASAEDLARVIRRLLDHPEDVETMGHQARRLVQETWNNDQQVEGLIRFYRRIHRS